MYYMIFYIFLSSVLGWTERENVSLTDRAQLSQVFYLIKWLNWSRVKRSILIGSLSAPNFARWTAHEVISLICVLEKIFERKHFG